jgi:hypothetical protein
MIMGAYPVTDGKYYKMAFAYALNNCAESFDDKGLQGDSSAKFPYTAKLTRMPIASFLNGSASGNCWLKTVKYIPHRTPNADLRLMTA